MASDTARLMDSASVRDGSDGGADMLSSSSSAAVTAPATAGGSARKDGRRLTPESDDGDDGEGGEESSGDDEGAKDGREWYEMREGLGEGSREQGHGRRRRRLLYTPDEERTVVGKFDRKLVVFMAVLYLLSFLDRSSTSISPPHRSHLH